MLLSFINHGAVGIQEGTGKALLSNEGDRPPTKPTMSMVSPPVGSSMGSFQNPDERQLT